jgi:hypothetical protein
VSKPVFLRRSNVKCDKSHYLSVFRCGCGKEFLTRKWAFFDVPFQFGANFTVGEVKEAEALARSYASGTPQQRANRAYREIRARKNAKSALSQVAKAATVLPFPRQGENPREYRLALLARLQGHLEAVRCALRGRDRSARACAKIGAVLAEGLSGGSHPLGENGEPLSL